MSSLQPVNCGPIFDAIDVLATCEPTLTAEEALSRTAASLGISVERITELLGFGGLFFVKYWDAATSELRA